MIVYVAAAGHTRTHQSVLDEPDRGFDFQLATYAELRNSKRLRRATYILSDLDRLSATQLREAAGFYRTLRDGGCRVLNNPARVLSRYGLLRTLHNAGLNSFNAYRVEEQVEPRRFPVFLRTEGDHGYPSSGLVNSPAELKQAVRRAVDLGRPLASLLVIEYAAEPIAGELFRKLSVFQVGGKRLACANVHQESWLVKYGTEGVATEELYEDEARIVRDNPYGDALARAFKLGGVDYGRADFGIVGGRVEVYEINSNPDVKLRPKPHPFARRVETGELYRQQYLQAMAELDKRPLPPRAPSAAEPNG